MTRIITSDEQLRRYLPNAFATAQGETPLYDKVLSWLQTAERWLFSQFVGDDFADTFLTLDPDEPVRVTAACVVAHEAMMRAVPSLDLVLTPNGFGIVSNQNVAPASRDRVARLIASLEASLDDCIEQLVAYLFRITEWYDTTIRHWFTATLFPFIDLANLCGFTDHRWANYLGLRSKAIDIDPRDPMISPLYGNMQSLTPTYLFIGTWEIFYTDVVKTYQMMKTAGVKATLHVAQKLGHVYPLWPCSEGSAAREEIAKLILQ